MFKLSKLSSKGFKRTACWNEYNVIGNKIVEIANNNEEKYIRKLLDSSRQGVKRLFALAYNNEEGDNKVSVDSYKKCFLPRVKIQNYKIEIDGKNFYDQPINDSIKQYDEIRKESTRKGDDHTTGYLLDFSYLKKKNRLIEADLSKQKALDTDSRVLQQIIFTGIIKAKEANTRVLIYYILEKSK